MNLLSHISYLYETEKERKDCDDDRIKEVKQYLNPQNGYIDLSSWGVTKAYGETIVG